MRYQDHNALTCPALFFKGFEGHFAAQNTLRQSRCHLSTTLTIQRTMSEEEECWDGASQLDRGPLSVCVFYPGTGSVQADRWSEKKGRKKKEQHSQAWTESVPARSAPALPTKLLGCPHLSDKWPKKEGSTKLSAEPFVRSHPARSPHPLFLSTPSHLRCFQISILCLGGRRCLWVTTIRE